MIMGNKAPTLMNVKLLLSYVWCSNTISLNVFHPFETRNYIRQEDGHCFPVDIK